MTTNTSPSIEDRLERIERSLATLSEGMQRLPPLISIAADSADDYYAHKKEQGIDLEDHFLGSLQLLERISKPEQITKLNTLLDLSDQLPGLISVVVDSLDDLAQQHGSELNDSLSFLRKDNLLFLKQAGDAINQAQQQPSKKLGLFGLLGAINDPDRQKALGFLMNVLKGLGQRI